MICDYCQRPTIFMRLAKYFNWNLGQSLTICLNCYFKIRVVCPQCKNHKAPLQQRD